MLKFGCAAALEGTNVAVLAEAQGVPEADGCLDAQLVLEGSERRGRVQGPITPSASCQAILKEHADDGHYYYYYYYYYYYDYDDYYYSKNNNSNNKTQQQEESEEEGEEEEEDG